MMSLLQETIMKKVNSKLLLFGVLLSWVLGFPQAVQSNSAQLYLSPSSGSFLVGSTFSVSIFINTESNEINVVQTELKFPPNILQVTSPTAGTSLITEWITPPSYSNERGIISFQGGIPGGISTSAGLVSSITFRAVTSGTARIEFTESSKVLLNDAKGTDILTSTINAKYQILIPPPEGPEVFSPTHPNPNVWYSDSSPAFSWEKESRVTDFSWSFDQNPSKRPDGISEGNEGQVSFTDVSDGIWYFHLRQKKQGVWGQTSHVQIRADVNTPKEFKPEVKSYNRLVSYQTLIYFETSDDYSGIDHYEVGLIDLSVPEPSRVFLTEETSPYKVPFKKPGKYNVIIKAVDRAGNIREQEIRFRLMTPLITHIEGSGLEIRGTLFSWWLVWLLTFVLLGGAGVLIWWLRKKYTKKGYP
ncbi:MAG: cohesin domain-containing protein [Patescibacteria group bacterium]|nr:cohesin domain-containing protein [Patescibacteria group bacterium]